MKRTGAKTTGAEPPLDNQEIARRLDEVAELLEAQEANPFRVRAYRSAAETVRSLKEPVHQLLVQQGAEGRPRLADPTARAWVHQLRVRQGAEGLTRLPGIGKSLAGAIEQLALSGRLGLHERLTGQASPELLFATVPGIGRQLASLIHEELGIETLAELQAAAYDGRLARVPGMGPKRLRGVRESLEGRYRRRGAPSESRAALAQGDLPPVDELLSVDSEYRQQAQAGRLLRIAPRRFNPTGEAWLPVLHTERGDRHYTALFSNTARAHELGTTRDWVVIYRDDHGGAGQWTVVTARLSRLKGRRIVRGRERECAEYYAQSSAPANA